MQKDCFISIKGSQYYNGEAEDGTIEFFTQGKFGEKNGSYFIIYKESQLTGMEGVTTTLKVEGNNRVIMTRTGTQRSQLIVEAGKRNLSHYDTGYGGLMIGVSGSSIKSTLGKDGGELTFDYTLDINSSVASKNKMSVTVTSSN